MGIYIELFGVTTQKSHYGVVDKVLIEESLLSFPRKVQYLEFHFSIFTY